jgi:hypothetical protein
MTECARVVRGKRRKGPVVDDWPFLILTVLISDYAADAICITPSCWYHDSVRSLIRSI